MMNEYEVILTALRLNGGTVINDADNSNITISSVGEYYQHHNSKCIAVTPGSIFGIYELYIDYLGRVHLSKDRIIGSGYVLPGPLKDIPRTTSQNGRYTAGIGSIVGAVSLLPLSSSLVFMNTINTGITSVSMSLTSNDMFAYVLNQGANTVSILTRNVNNGSMIVSPIAVNNDATPYDCAISPDNNYLYVISWDSGVVTTYAIDQRTGGLSFRNTVSAGNDSSVIKISSDGLNVYVLNWVTNNVSVYSRDNYTGLLTLIDTTALPASNHDMVITPNGKFIYLSDFINNVIYIYGRNVTTGLLTLVNTMVCPTVNAYNLTVSPDGKNLYQTCWSYGNYVVIYSIDSTTGALTHLVDIGTGISPEYITVSRDNLNVYVTNNSDSSIDVYSRAPSTGLLTHMCNNVLSAVPGKISLSNDSANVYILLNDNTVSIHKIQNNYN